MHTCGIGHVRTPLQDHSLEFPTNDEYSARGVAILSACVATLVAGHTVRSKQSWPRRGKTVRHASSSRAAQADVKCGDKMRAKVTKILDIGLYVLTADGIKLFIPCSSQQRAKEDYVVGEDLEVTIIHHTVSGKSNNDMRASDRPLKPWQTVQIGDIVDGRVLYMSDHLVLLDINVSKDSYAYWPNLEPLGKDRSEYHVGDTIPGLRVRANKPDIELVAASLELRRINEFKVGEKVKGFVVDVVQSVGAVFFDVGQLLKGTNSRANLAHA